MEFTLLTVSLFITAGVYASVGLGGGTAYLAVLSFWETDPHLLRPVAWELNILCSVTVFYNYYRCNFFVWKIAWPYLLGGTLGAVMGAAVPIDPTVFRGLLAATLLLAGVRMLIQKQQSANDPEIVRTPPLLWSLLAGFVVGLLSGLVGIGGGIVLGPILIGLGWVPIKRTAAITSAYILICSFFALLTHGATMGISISTDTLVLGSVVIIAGFLGSYYGSGKASPIVLRKIFAIVVLIAALNLLAGFVSK